MLSAIDISGLCQLLQDLVSSLLLMLPGISGGLDWWIGLSDTGHEGHWLWVSESVFLILAQQGAGALVVKTL